jgi:hypothetical protein
MIEYREQKSWRGLVSRIKVKHGKIYVDAYLWASQDALQENVLTDNEYLVACYLPIPIRNCDEGTFGEFNFCLDELGFKTVAHELTHFIIDLKRMQCFEDEDTAEFVGELAERLTQEFLSKTLTDPEEYV